MLNHCIHAWEDIDSLLQNGSFASLPLTEQVHRDVFELLDQAVKFELPDNGIVTDLCESLEKLEPNELHLPFPVVALEYCCSIKDLPADMIPAKKRIALCLDYAANKNSAVARLALEAFPQIDNAGGLIVIPCYFS